MDHSRGNAIELIEGSQAAVNMTATANPLPIEYQWSKESTALGNPSIYYVTTFEGGYFFLEVENI